MHEKLKKILVKILTPFGEHREAVSNESSDKEVEEEEETLRRILLCE